MLSQIESSKYGRHSVDVVLDMEDVGRLALDRGEKVAREAARGLSHDYPVGISTSVRLTLYQHIRNTLGESHSKFFASADAMFRRVLNRDG